jgi:hypothetical protein
LICSAVMDLMCTYEQYRAEGAGLSGWFWCVPSTAGQNG